MPRVSGSSSFEGILIDWTIAHPVVPSRLPVAWLSREQKAAELARLQAEKAARAAYEAELIVGLAEDTPELPDDHPATGRGSWSPDSELPGVDESFTPELSMILNCGRRSASVRAQRSWTYVKNLPATHAALCAGTLDEPRAIALADVLQFVAPGLARQVEAALVPEAVQLSIPKLKKRALALLLEKDSAAVDELREETQRQADVHLYPSPRTGMSTLGAELPDPEAAECFDVVDRLAQLLKADGDPRPIGQLRTVVLSDLIRRPWDTTRPPVSAQLTIVATLAALAGRSAEAGEVNGLAITAAHVRELLAEVGALGLRTPEGGSLTLAITGPDGQLLATVTPEQLQRLARRGCPRHPAGDCGCPVLDRPADTDAYEPTDAQRTWIKTRDRSCRFPQCGQRVGWADLDHVIPHACGGDTTCTNLCCLCRSHHRLKTRRTDWAFTMSEDGVLTVTTPSGITRTTRPPGMRPPPAESREPASGKESTREPEPYPPVASDPEDDPPPF